MLNTIAYEEHSYSKQYSVFVLYTVVCVYVFVIYVFFQNKLYYILIFLGNRMWVNS